MFACRHVLDGQPIEDHHQMGIVQVDATHLFILIVGQLETTGFQTFVIEGVAAARPVEELHLVTPLVDKDEHVTVAGVARQLVFDQAGKPIETFSHISGPVVQQETVFRGEGEHLVEQGQQGTEAIGPFRGGAFQLDPIGVGNLKGRCHSRGDCLNGDKALPIM